MTRSTVVCQLMSPTFSSGFPVQGNCANYGVWKNGVTTIYNEQGGQA